ncbi:pyridoxal phosphate-dependent aminotransferase [Anaplasmataceae bacterium AB001_6]|nr:pyridoxal phosphate-dependent aminotransferase [Anaplasmataceae bacterium AB001_6]
MNLYLSDGVLRIKGGMISSQISNRAQQLKEQGREIISLNLGEPDFNTEQSISDAAINAVNDHDTHYPPMDGKVQLKDAVIAKMKRDSNLIYSRDQVLICGGAKQAIFNVFMTILNKDDEVILFKPYWFSYVSMLEFIGAKPVMVDCNEDFSIDAADLQSKISSKTKMIVINSPSNPSGYVYVKKDFDAISDIMRKNEQISVLTDDIYEYIVYDVKYSNILDENKDLLDRVYIVNGLSKAYAMTGWRVGYVASGNEEVMKKMRQFHVNSSGAVCSIAQRAAIAALNEISYEQLNLRCDIFRQRRDIVVNLLNSIAGLKVHIPQGAFYVLPSCAGVIGKKTPKGEVISNDYDFVMYLLEEYYVAVTPAVIFGIPNHFRISYAASEENLRIACKRIKDAISNLS